jgi:hypothetical protein
MLTLLVLIAAAAPPRPVSTGPEDGGLAGNEVTGRGSLDPELIRQVIHANRAKVRGCYEAPLRDAPKLAGKISIKFVIGVTGTVGDVEVGEDDVHSEALAKCLVAAVKTWKFPAPKGGVVKVTYPLSFDGRSGD